MGLFNPITSLIRRFIFIISIWSDMVIMNISKLLNGSIKLFFNMIVMLINQACFQCFPSQHYRMDSLLYSYFELSRIFHKIQYTLQKCTGYTGLSGLRAQFDQFPAVFNCLLQCPKGKLCSYIAICYTGYNTSVLKVYYGTIISLATFCQK